VDEIFEIKDKDLMGRIGLLHTRSMKIETPLFFPVIHPIRNLREISVEDIKKIGFNTLITNAYLVKKFYGEKIFETGLKKILGFEGVLMTDSGAYQIMQYGNIDVSNREIVEYQEKMDQDIAVILDIPTRSDVSYEEAERSVEETFKRAYEVLDIINKSEKLWVLPIQGGGYKDLVYKSAVKSLELPGYKIYGIGSPVTFLENYEYDKILENIFIVKKILPPDKPVHLFGAGHPMIIPFIVASGVDMFDSASYILYARENRYVTEYGTERLEDLEYFPCSCPVCSRYTPKELMEMNREERTRLLAIHNLYMIYKELKRVKTALKEGRLWELLIERSHSHPRLRSVIKIFIREKDFIEKYSPFSKGRRGLFITEYESLYRPNIQRSKNRNFEVLSYKIIKKICEEIIFIPADLRYKPFSSSPVLKNVFSQIDIRKISCTYYYTPVLGILNISIEEAYPYSQTEIAREVIEDPRVIEVLKKELVEVLDNLRRIREDLNIVMYFVKELDWSLKLYENLNRDLEKINIKTIVL
jgi:7-cyano-7-deazaguanine tRNA-ribosyltransferase